MKKAIIITVVYFTCFACTKNEQAVLLGQWKLTEELIDIGDGNGVFKETGTQQILEFFPDGTYSSTSSFCPGNSDSNQKGTGIYSLEKNILIPKNCVEEVAGIPFDYSGQELILSLSCIEPCKQKYQKID